LNANKRRENDWNAKGEKMIGMLIKSEKMIGMLIKGEKMIGMEKMREGGDK